MEFLGVYFTIIIIHKLEDSRKVQHHLKKNSFEEIHESIKWWKNIIDFFSKTHLLQDYFGEQNNRLVLEEFIKHYNNALRAVDKKNKSHLFG